MRNGIHQQPMDPGGLEAEPSEKMRGKTTKVNTVADPGEGGKGTMRPPPSPVENDNKNVILFRERRIILIGLETVYIYCISCSE